MRCHCGAIADVYAGGTGSGDWADRYCEQHIPRGFVIFDDYRVPSCDVCGMREEDVRGWCGTCGNCSSHCEGYIDCPID